MTGKRRSHYNYNEEFMTSPFDRPPQPKDSIIEDSSTLINAKTEIRRNITSSKPDLPLYTGLELYRKILDFFGDYAITHQKNVQHVVFYSTEMNIDKWKQKFLPILKEYGYEDAARIDHHVSYIKTYKPEFVTEPANGRDI